MSIESTVALLHSTIIFKLNSLNNTSNYVLMSPGCGPLIFLTIAKPSSLSGPNCFVLVNCWNFCRKTNPTGWQISILFCAPIVTSNGFPPFSFLASCSLKRGDFQEWLIIFSFLGIIDTSVMANSTKGLKYKANSKGNWKKIYN